MSSFGLFRGRKTYDYTNRFGIEIADSSTRSLTRQASFDNLHQRLKTWNMINTNKYE